MTKKFRSRFKSQPLTLLETHEETRLTLRPNIRTEFSPLDHPEYCGPLSPAKWGIKFAMYYLVGHPYRLAHGLHGCSFVSVPFFSTNHHQRQPANSHWHCFRFQLISDLAPAIKNFFLPNLAILFKNYYPINCRRFHFQGRHRWADFDSLRQRVRSLLATYTTTCDHVPVIEAAPKLAIAECLCSQCRNSGCLQRLWLYTIAGFWTMHHPWRSSIRLHSLQGHRDCLGSQHFHRITMQSTPASNVFRNCQ